MTEPPVHTDRYELRDELGRGAFGVVRLAWDHVLERSVAVKLLLPHVAAEEVALLEYDLRFTTA